MIAEGPSYVGWLVALLLLGTTCYFHEDVRRMNALDEKWHKVSPDAEHTMRESVDHLMRKSKDE